MLVGIWLKINRKTEVRIIITMIRNLITIIRMLELLEILRNEWRKWIPDQYEERENNWKEMSGYE